MTGQLPIERFRAALEDNNSRIEGKRRDDFMAQCPAHDDRKPSLHVSVGKSDRVLLKCFAECDLDTILASLSLSAADLFAERAVVHSFSARPVSAAPVSEVKHDYRNAQRDVVYQVIRQGPKSFKQRRLDGTGKWIYNMKGVARLPYRLPELIESTGMVYVVEGEKDADRLHDLGLIATTNVGGATKFGAELATWFEGRDVAIVPDNDARGKAHAHTVVSVIEPVAKSIRIVELPDLEVKGDVSDWLDAGNEPAQLEALVLAAEPLDVDSIQMLCVDSSSWEPVDLAAIVNGFYVAPVPTELVRSDGLGLFYRGQTNAIFGESESGKSWVVQWACVQALARGEAAVYLDFEATASVVVERLKLLGATAEQLLNRFAYIQPLEPLRGQLNDLLDRLNPALVVLDGVTDAMDIHSLDSNATGDSSRFDREVGRAIADRGPAYVSVDHVPKNGDKGGRYAIGSQHKRAAVRGAAYRFELVDQFAPGHIGCGKLVIAKDRLGAVRAEHLTSAGTFHLDATDESRLVAEVRAPDQQQQGDQTFQPTYLMEQVSRTLEGHEPLSTAKVEKAVTGRNANKKLAVDALVDGGYVERTPGARNAVLHRSLKPYREHAASQG